MSDCTLVVNIFSCLGQITWDGILVGTLLALMFAMVGILCIQEVKHD